MNNKRISTLGAAIFRRSFFAEKNGSTELKIGKAV